MEEWLEHFARAAFARSSDTAHDLKTPLNVAVLNLELLRMRLKKIAGAEEDPKLAEYARAIEFELRRMGQIFDAFFVLSTPPKTEGGPVLVDAAVLCAEAASSAGYGGEEHGPAAMVRAHEGRIRQGYALFFEGASSLFPPEEGQLSREKSEKSFIVNLSGRVEEEIDLSKIFKFYYTDAGGDANLSLAAARIIAESYGGVLNASKESDKVSLRFTLPLGEQ